MDEITTIEKAQPRTYHVSGYMGAKFIDDRTWDTYTLWKKIKPQNVTMTEDEIREVLSRELCHFYPIRFGTNFDRLDIEEVVAGEETR